MFYMSAANAEDMVMSRDDKLQLPDFSQTQFRNSVITKIKLHFQCVGVRSVEFIPDGWEVHVQPSGEMYDVIIERTDSEEWLKKLGIPDRAANSRALGKIRIAVTYRGQWSDCASVGLVLEGVNADSGDQGSTFSRAYRGSFFKTWEIEGNTEAKP